MSVQAQLERASELTFSKRWLWSSEVGPTAASRPHMHADYLLGSSCSPPVKPVLQDKQSSTCKRSLCVSIFRWFDALLAGTRGTLGLDVFATDDLACSEAFAPELGRIQMGFSR